MSSETDLQNAIRKAVGMVPSLRLFRNNNGEAWLGKVIDKTPTTITIARPLRVVYGLGEGTSDLIGWTKRTITAEDVGKTMAVFTGWEIKRPGEVLPVHQEKWRDFVRFNGGIAEVVTSVEQGRKMAGI